MPKKLTKEEFIEKAQKVHGGKFDYSKVKYTDNATKVCIVCPIHGEFYQTPRGHLSGKGCRKCGVKKRSEDRKSNSCEFICKANAIHGNKYDYSKVKYKRNHENVCIVCPEHGEFLQTPHNHLAGKGCPKCGMIRAKECLKTNESEFKVKASKIHGCKYDYSKVEYVNNLTKVCIICPEHGEFWQVPSSHLDGHGCPKCYAQKMRSRLVCGVGLNDYNKKITDDKGEVFKSYKIWTGVIKRCYDEKTLKKSPSYKDCYVCDEWKYFSVFKEWFDKHYIEGYQLDKDILIQDNRVYSPNTCCFVPQRINTILLDCKAARGKYKRGVSYCKRNNKYIASVCDNGKHKHLGYFTTEEEAYREYCKHKKEIIRNTALEYLHKGKISKEVYVALLNYKI